MGYTIGTLSSRQSSATNPVTLSVTVASDEELLVVMLVTVGATDRAGGALTWGSTTLTQAGTTQKAAASPESSAELWYALNPTAGTQTLTIPNTASRTIQFHACRAKVRAGAIATFLAQNGANNTSSNPTVTVACGEGDCILFSVVASGATSWNPSARDGTQISDTDSGAQGDGFQYKINANPGSQAMGWTFGTSDDWGVCAAAFGEEPPLALNNYAAVKVSDGMSTGEKIR
jgi:hypothetical protein